MLWAKTKKKILLKEYIFLLYNMTKDVNIVDLRLMARFKLSLFFYVFFILILIYYLLEALERKCSSYGMPIVSNSTKENLDFRIRKRCKTNLNYCGFVTKKYI